MGTKYPSGESPVYPPRDWTCPVRGCRKYHSKPHFAFPGQINYKKKPLEPGRVKFNREDGCGGALKGDTEIRTELGSKTGPETVTIHGQVFAAPLFCPHCGWEEEFIYIFKIKGQWTKVKKGVFKKIPHCSIGSCEKPSKYTNEEKYLCHDHHQQLKTWGLIE